MRWSTAWALDQAAPSADPLGAGPTGTGRAILSAGIDRLVEIDGLFDSDIALLHRWAAGEAVDTSAAPRLLVDQLIGLGVLLSDVATSADGTVTKVVVGGGEVADALAAAVVDHLSSLDHLEASVIATDDSEPARGAPITTGIDLVVALRTHDRVGLDHRRDWPILHVDLRHEHTLVVGPAELPGLSACDTCYDIRLARRWRLPTLPERPGVLDSQGLVAALIAFHVERFIADGSHLVNATIAHSMRDGTATRDALLRVPGCPGCGPQRSTNGRVRLPWSS